MRPPVLLRLKSSPAAGLKRPAWSAHAGHGHLRRLHQSGAVAVKGRLHYDNLKRDFRFNPPQDFNFPRDVLDKHAADENLAHCTALRHVADDGAASSETVWTYAELSTLSKRAAATIADALNGSHKGAVVVLPKVPEWWLLNAAAGRCAHVPLLPGTPLLTPWDLAKRFVRSGADAVFGDVSTAQKVEKAAKLRLFDPSQLRSKILVVPRQSQSREDTGALEAIGWQRWDQLLEANGDREIEERQTSGDDIMQIFFTSGTTGEEKMVPHTHASCGYCHVVTAKYWLGLTPDDLHWNVSDTGWAKSAWSSVFGPWYVGASVFVHGMERFDAMKVLDVLDAYPITTLCAPPTLFRSMVQEDLTHHRFNDLRHCVSAGEPLNEEVVLSWEAATGLVIKEGYGQTESTLLAASFPGFEVRPGSMGKAAPGYDVRVVNNMGEEVARGEQGNIAVNLAEGRPAGLFAGYLDDPVATEKSEVGHFYLTGDRAYMDEDGYIWFVARDDDIIISAGYRIGPFEVESALLEHPAVMESAVVASPDSVRGQVVKAFVVLAEAFKDHAKDPELATKLTTELQAFVRRKTAPYKHPRKVEFVESLPKTVSGKIRRAKLRNSEKKSITRR